MFQLSEENRLKLIDLLKDHSMLEQNPGVQDRVADGSCSREAVLAPLSDSDSTALEPAHCKYYKDGKCVKTYAFCDLCKTADEIVVSDAKSSAKRGRSLRSSPFTSVLGKLTGNFRSTFRNH